MARNGKRFVLGLLISEKHANFEPICDYRKVLLGLVRTLASNGSVLCTVDRGPRARIPPDLSYDQICNN